MLAAADGDRAALDPLFHALWPRCVAFAERMLGDRALAEDCAQDALVKLFGQLDRFDRERDALTWALAIATWEARTVRRRRARRGGARAGAPAAAPAAGSRHRAVTVCLPTLPHPMPPRCSNIASSCAPRSP